GGVEPLRAAPKPPPLSAVLCFHAPEGRVSAGIAIGFFTSAAAGILGALLLAPFRELGRFFFVLNAGLAFLLLCLAAPFRVSSPSAAPAGRILAAVAMALLIGYVSALLLLRRGRSWTGLLVPAGAAFFVAGLLWTGARSPLGLGRFLSEIAIDRGVFFWQRVFFGFLGPAAFAYMVHETARIRSTQSATGILYLGVIFVVYGEF